MSSTTLATLPTATLVAPLAPPTVAVTFVSPPPLAAAVNRPPLDTVPSDESATVQFAACAGTCTVAPVVDVPDSASCRVWPLFRSGSAGDTLSDASLLTTSMRCTVWTRPSRPYSSPVPACLAVNWPPAHVPSDDGTTVAAIVPAAGLS